MLRTQLAQGSRGQATQECCNAFDESTQIGIDLCVCVTNIRIIIQINFNKIQIHTWRSAVQSANARSECVAEISNHQKTWTIRYTQQPPISWAHVFRATTLGEVLPSSISSMWVYGHALASPQTNDHQMVSRNRKIA